MLECGETGTESTGVARNNAHMSRLMAGRPGVYFFDPRAQLCPGDKCSAYLDRRLVYFDASHLSMEGSWVIGRRIVRAQGVPGVFRQLGGEPSEMGARPLDQVLFETGKTAAFR